MTMSRKDAELVATALAGKLHLRGSIDERMIRDEAKAVAQASFGHAALNNTISFEHQDGTKCTFYNAELVDLNPRWVGIMTENHGIIVEDRSTLIRLVTTKR